MNAKEKLTGKQAPVKPKLSTMQLIPMTIIVGVLTVGILQIIGVIDIQGILNPSNIIEMYPPATINVPYTYDFSSELIPLVGQGPYTFYLGSGVGFPPMGLILGIDGVLKGTPTGQGSTFQVCVKDVSGTSACKMYHLSVDSTSSTSTITTRSQGNCPATSCDTGNCCHSTKNGVGVTGVITYASCNCPSDTTFAGMDNTAPGGPYKICTCK